MVMSDAPFLAATRASYNAIAAEYADLVSGDLDTKGAQLLPDRLSDRERDCGL